MPKKQSSDSLITDLLRLFRHLPRRRRFQLLVLLVLLVANSLSEMVSVGAIVPFLSVLGNAQGILQSPRWQPLLGQLQIQTPQQLVWAVSLGVIAAVGINSGLRLLILNFQNRLMAEISSEISSKMYRNTLYQPYSFHVQQNSSDLLQTITSDTTHVSALLGVLIALVQYILLAPALTSALLLINWQVVVSLSLVLGITYMILFNQRKRLLRRNGTLMAEANQQRIKVVQEGVGGIRDVLLDNSQDFFERIYSQNDRLLNRLFTANAVIIGSPGIVIEFVAMTAIALLTLTMGQGGDFSKAVPVLGGLTLGVKRLLPTLQGLFGNLGSLQTSRAPLLRALVALERPIDPLMLRLAPLPLGLERNLQLDRVWFRYNADNDWVLRGLDLTIAARTTVAFVGSTGSGKSTTADLILGLLQPNRGQILVDGEPLVGERLRRWQRAIAHVPQQIYLSDASLAENIAFGIPAKEIDLAQVRWAARLAQVSEFIEGLPAGYDTYVGERGIRLSGGQRQRIGIARALYKQASVIVFDEATSALDNATEREVMTAIEGLGGQFTIILIAHRLSTVERCDLVVELSQGRVVAQGSYKELIAKSASFQRMAGVVK